MAQMHAVVADKKTAKKTKKTMKKSNRHAMPKGQKPK